jgi:hypothetical protein
MGFLDKNTIGGTSAAVEIQSSCSVGFTKQGNNKK